MQRAEENREAVIWKLVKIEENVHKLACMLENEPLQKREAIDRLLDEIVTIATRSRRRIIEIGMLDSDTKERSFDGIVTAKEVRELLEAFA
jgi:hypothetical protein